MTHIVILKPHNAFCVFDKNVDNTTLQLFTYLKDQSLDIKEATEFASKEDAEYTINKVVESSIYTLDRFVIKEKEEYLNEIATKAKRIADELVKQLNDNATKKED